MIVQNSVLLLKSQFTKDGQDKYESLLRANNFEVNQVSTLAFNFKNINILRDNLNKNNAYTGLILSSPRCVQAVALAIRENGFLEQWKANDNFVVGEATYKEALENLSLECQGKECGNALNLTKLILQSKIEKNFSKPFLFPHGNLKSDTLNLELGKEGVEIEGVEVYETIANPNIEQDLAKVTNNFTLLPEFVVFFSPSGFTSAIELIQMVSVDINLVKFIAIGPVTEMAINKRNFDVYGVAKQPTPEDLLRVILNKL